MEVLFYHYVSPPSVVLLMGQVLSDHTRHEVGMQILQNNVETAN